MLTRKEKVEYSVSLEPERTALSLEMNTETRDKIEKQGINRPETRDKTDKTRDKIEHLEGISQKTRDNLVDNGLLLAKGDKKERTYHFKSID